MRNAKWIGAAVVLLAGGITLGYRPAETAESAVSVWVLKRDGTRIEGRATLPRISVRSSAGHAVIAPRDLCSYSSALPATPGEGAKITGGLQSVAGKDPRAAENAMAELTDLGLPVLTPLLKSFEDRDGRQPDPLYRLYGRILPGQWDAQDRAADLVRVTGGGVRGHVEPFEISLQTGAGPVRVASDEIRRLAVRRPVIERTFDLQAMRDCTYVSWLDTGIGLTSDSKLRSDAQGYVRLSYDEDGWACDPDGIADPLPGKRRLQEGFRWGAILGRVGPTGERWLVGKHVEKSPAAAGRLYYVINDNEHWQNNIGSFRVRLRVTDAYDLNDPG